MGDFRFKAQQGTKNIVQVLEFIIVFFFLSMIFMSVYVLTLDLTIFHIINYVLLIFILPIYICMYAYFFLFSFCFIRKLIIHDIM